MRASTKHSINVVRYWGKPEKEQKHQKSRKIVKIHRKNFSRQNGSINCKNQSKHCHLTGKNDIFQIKVP